MHETQETTDLQDMARMLRESARDFCARALPRSRLRALREATPAFDRALWTQMAELGWASVLAPGDNGGLGLGIGAMAAVCREVGAVAALEPLVETAVVATTLAAAAGEPTLLAAIADGSRVITGALGEVNADPFASLSVMPRAHGHALRGTLARIPLGTDADAWLVPAQVAGEPAWCHVDAAASGIAATPLPLADGTRDARVAFDDTPATVLLRGAPARAAYEHARTRAEVASSAYLLGLVDALLGMTLEYMGTRRQFGQAIGSFQALQHRLVDQYLQQRLLDAVVHAACAAVDDEVDAAAAAARARFRACEAGLLIAREAIQMHGAMGYTDECDVGLCVNRLLVIVARYGNAQTHAQRLAGRDAAGSAQSRVTSAVDPDLPMPIGGWNALDDDTFRAVVRGWHEKHYPVHLRNPPRRLRWHECRDWYATLYARGWAAPGWPAEHGGMGLSPDKFLIFVEERERLGVARTPDQGIIMVGPVLMQHGSTAQQAYWLPRALSGEHIWCQGYSEPNAGSDLASLRTRAVRDGEEFVISGQKIWTTMAQDATHMFCLVRTDPDAKPQSGISFLLIDMKSPGITVRPIRNISGDAEFCEVFLDEVRTPAANLVGALNDGWTIAKALLGFERLFIGSPKTCQYALNRLTKLADACGLSDDPVFVARCTRFRLDVADLETLFKSFADIVRRGGTLGADVSVLKIWASETYSRIAEFIVECAGEAGAQVGDVGFGDIAVDVMSQYYNSRPTTIYGGSNEIQRNIIAKQVLKLPSR
ncbi:MAG: acyl-CoA dehydrogenase family protein [Gammaproteobacteria bacterium]